MLNFKVASSAFTSSFPVFCVFFIKDSWEAAAEFALALTAAISVQGADIRTMVHCGHPVKDFAVSYDERYVLTRSEGEVCVWDLNNRLLVAALPLYTTEIFPHPTDPRLFYADVRRFKLKAVEDPTLDANRVIDWKTGKSLGLVKAASMPKSVCMKISSPIPSRMVPTKISSTASIRIL